MRRGWIHHLTFVVGVTLSLGSAEAGITLRYFPRDLLGDPIVSHGIDLCWGDRSVAENCSTVDLLLVLDTTIGDSCPSRDDVEHKTDFSMGDSFGGMENTNGSLYSGAGYGGLALSNVERLQRNDLRSDALAVAWRAILPRGPVTRWFRPPRA
jgi:hypothetical protein